MQTREAEVLQAELIRQRSFAEQAAQGMGLPSRAVLEELYELRGQVRGVGAAHPGVGVAQGQLKAGGAGKGTALAPTEGALPARTRWCSALHWPQSGLRSSA